MSVMKKSVFLALAASALPLAAADDTSVLGCCGCTKNAEDVKPADKDAENAAKSLEQEVGATMPGAEDASEVTAVPVVPAGEEETAVVEEKGEEGETAVVEEKGEEKDTGRFPNMTEALEKIEKLAQFPESKEKLAKLTRPVIAFFAKVFATCCNSPPGALLRGLPSGKKLAEAVAKIEEDAKSEGKAAAVESENEDSAGKSEESLEVAAEMAKAPTGDHGPVRRAAGAVLSKSLGAVKGAAGAVRDFVTNEEVADALLDQHISV